jgi:hypothetical protein
MASEATPGHVALQLGADNPRVNGVGRARRACKPPRELLGKQHVRELGTTVRFPAVVAALATEIVEVDADSRSAAMQRAAHHDDAGGWRKRPEQARHEQEVPEVVGEELKLVAVGELQPRQRHDARVADDAAELQALALHRF